MSKISKAKFLRYENLRKSGDTNMYDLDYVKSVTWLTKDEVIAIMQNYHKLAEKYLKSGDN